MSITNLHSSQINVVAGGRTEGSAEQAINNLVAHIFDEHPIFIGEELGQCISASKTRYGFTLCMPAKKPLNCPYGLWEMLHDLTEEMPQC
jgi:hypothetical protein